MRNILIIMRREIRSYFVSPLGYVILGVFLFLSAYLFYPMLARFADLCLQYGNNPYYLNMLNVNDLVVRPFFGLTKFIFLFAVPAITMRQFAEEKKNGTAELLLTAPITPFELVVGKFLGGLGMIVALLTLALLFPAILFWVGDPDLSPILIGYLGLILLGAAFVAIGLIASSLTENQIIAFLTSFGILFVLWLISFPAGRMGPPWGDILSYLSVMDHMEDFEKGIVDTTHVIFYLSVAAFSLFLTQRVIESKRWR